MTWDRERILLRHFLAGGITVSMALQLLMAHMYAFSDRWDFMMAHAHRDIPTYDAVMMTMSAARYSRYADFMGFVAGGLVALAISLSFRRGLLSELVLSLLAILAAVPMLISRIAWIPFGMASDGTEMLDKGLLELDSLGLAYWLAVGAQIMAATALAAFSIWALIGALRGWISVVRGGRVGRGSPLAPEPK